MLAAVREAVDEVGRQLRVAHFPLSGFDIVFDAIKLDSFPILIPDRETRSRIAVARLADRAGIDEELLARLAFDGDEFVEFVARRDRGIAGMIRTKDNGEVAVAEERDVLFGQGEILLGIR